MLLLTDHTAVRQSKPLRRSGSQVDTVTVAVRTSNVYTLCVKNVTLSADDGLLEAARAKARAANRTLNDEFREWLETYVGREDTLDRAMTVIDRIAVYASTGGYHFSRDEMNER